MTDDLDALEQAARAAGGYSAEWPADDAINEWDWAWEEAQFVSAASPDVILRLIAAVREADALRAAISDHVPSGGEGMDGYGYVECSCGWLSTSKVSWSDHVLRAALSPTEPSDDR